MPPESSSSPSSVLSPVLPKLQLRPRPLQPATTYRWLDEQKFPYLADTFSKLPYNADYSLPDSDPEDDDYHPPEEGQSPRCDSVDLESASIPSTPSSTDLFAWDLRVITPPGHHDGQSETRQPQLGDGGGASTPISVQLDRVGQESPETSQNIRIWRSPVETERPAHRRDKSPSMDGETRMRMRCREGSAERQQR